MGAKHNFGEAAFSEEELWNAYLDTDSKLGSSITESKAHVRCNVVTTLDAAMALDGRSKRLSCAHDRAIFRVLRAQSDVIVAGAATIKADDYGAVDLPESLKQRRLALGMASLPRLAIVSRSLSLDHKAKPFVSPSGTVPEGDMRPIVLTTSDSPVSERHRLASVATVVVTKDANLVTPQGLVRALEDMGLSRILCEGGASLIRFFATQHRIDELCLTLRAMLAGDQDAHLSGGVLEHPINFSLHNTLVDEKCVFLRLVKTRESDSL